ncbi:MAG: PilZ domain-containing protein [Nitrospira sp.]|nr:PilZ domain-containing protein [Nitrospira sp.]
MEEKRGHVRVYDRLQIAYRFIENKDWVSSENPEKYFPHIWCKYPSSIVFDETEESNLKILPHIADLNRKIDLLIELLLPDNKGLHIEVPAERDVSISGSGIRMEIIEPAYTGQKIALCIVLPLIPLTNLFIAGEVKRSVRSESSEGKEKGLFEIGIKFLDLKDDDYEKIVKYIFKKQRDFLRNKKMLTTDDSFD